MVRTDDTADQAYDPSLELFEAGVAFAEAVFGICDQPVLQSGDELQIAYLAGASIELFCKYILAQSDPKRLLRKGKKEHKTPVDFAQWGKAKSISGREAVWSVYGSESWDKSNCEKLMDSRNAAAHIGLAPKYPLEDSERLATEIVRILGWLSFDSLEIYRRAEAMVNGFGERIRRKLQKHARDYSAQSNVDQSAFGDFLNAGDLEPVHLVCPACSGGATMQAWVEDVEVEEEFPGEYFQSAFYTVFLWCPECNLQLDDHEVSYLEEKTQITYIADPSRTDEVVNCHRPERNWWSR